MAINLKKGDSAVVTAQKFKIGLGWNPSGNSKPFDLDVSVFGINSQTQKLVSDEYLCFYNNLIIADGSLIHSPDDKSGSVSDGGDDEWVDVNISKLNPNVDELIVVVTIEKAIERSQTFGQVKDAYIRIESNGQELMKFELNEDFSIETSVVFGKLIKTNDKWNFVATGLGYREDLEYFVNQYA